MTEAEFRALAALGYNRIPLVLEAFADLDTPLSLYLKLANQRYTYLLESVVGGERFGRYSFIGLPAKLRIRSRGRQIEVEDRGGIVERHEGDPLAFIGAFLGRYRAAPRPGLPRFCGGLAGYFGYDTVRHVETKLAASAPAPTAELAEIPDILLLLTEELAVVDNLSGKIGVQYEPNRHLDLYATITRGYVDPPTPIFRFNGEPAYGLSVAMAQGGDVLKLGHDCVFNFPGRERLRRTAFPTAHLGRTAGVVTNFGLIAFRVGWHHGSLAGFANQEIAKESLLWLPCPLGFDFRVRRQ